jgi:DNA-binding HxlR family transcriptional regulator/putative sterol carrier protein
MTRRTYRQHCALARALDLVGERWTLLVVRELLTSPKRYSNLLDNLPGMGTNLLAARLRGLQEAGLVDHDGTLYSLTPRGAELEPAVLALARFGAPLLAEGLAAGNQDDLWRASWNVVALKYAFRPERARKLRGVLEYQVDGTRVQARLRDGTIETTAEPRWKPDVVVRTDGETLLALSSGELAFRQAEAEGALEIEGDRRLFRASLRAFGAE